MAVKKLVTVVTAEFELAIARRFLLFLLVLSRAILHDLAQLVSLVESSLAYWLVRDRSVGEIAPRVERVIWSVVFKCFHLLLTFVWFFGVRSCSSLSQNTKIVNIPWLAVFIILQLDQIVLNNPQLNVLPVKFLKLGNRNSTEALVHICN